MLEVQDALAAVLEQARPLPPRRMPAHEALGLMLAQDVVSDVDSPPHDKSIVDGFAVRSDDVASFASLSIIEEVTAGDVPQREVARGTCTRIMTGAPIPSGADAVVMVEKTDPADADRVTIRETGVRSGQNIARRASSMSAGQTVLFAGRRLRGIELGLLAEVGCEEVDTIPRPRVAFAATGNELVSPREMPGPGRIRNSNGPLLDGLVRQAGGEPIDLGIARDDVASLREAFTRGLEHDVLVVSGGVSAGVLDLVPQVLASLGMRCVFHKINLKPGKPLWFGVRSSPKEATKLVFGLPGNPVSTLVCFELFVRPAIARLSGRIAHGLERREARLATAFQQRGGRFTLFPGSLNFDGDQAIVAPLAWRGSGDLRTLTEADCLIEFPVGERTFAAGETVAVRVLPT